jgi:hypothetical protein
VSTQSKSADRWSQVFAAAATRPPGWCKGCGYWPLIHRGCHRADCTLSEDDRAVRLAINLLGARVIDCITPSATGVHHVSSRSPLRRRSHPRVAPDVVEAVLAEMREFSPQARATVDAVLAAEKSQP